MKSITFNLNGHAHARAPRPASRPTVRLQIPICKPCGPTAAESSLSTVSNLSFTWLANVSAGAGGAAMRTPLAQEVARMPVVKAVVAKYAPTIEDGNAYCDQYSVGIEGQEKTGLERFWELAYAVAISNDVRNREGSISKLLGPRGHYERMSFWVHFLGAFIFLVYAFARSGERLHEQRVDGALTSAAGYTIGVVFLTSSLYHCTAPDQNFAYVTRVLDYAAIYTGIAVATTADIAVATRGFENVPYQTVADLPVAACLLIAFFVWRRWRLPAATTWSAHEIEKRARDGCLLGRGLFSFGHRDLHHSQARQATSLLLFASYFMSVPAAFRVLGDDVANVVVALQVAGFVSVALGMAIDRVFQWPDGLLVEGSVTCLACPSNPSGAGGLGAVCNSHSVWHLVALLSAALTCVSREYALASA